RLPSVETVQRRYRQTFAKPRFEYAVQRAMQVTAPHVSKLTISGPFQATSATKTPSRRAIFICRPATAADETPCAKTIMTALARRAYRRLVSEADIQPLMVFYTQTRAQGDSFDAGIEVALRGLLVSTDFWFRIERDPANAPAKTVYRIGDQELASRL